MDLQAFLKKNDFAKTTTSSFSLGSNSIDVSKINETPKAAPKAHDLNDFLTGKASSLDPAAESTLSSKKEFVEYPVPDYPPFIATITNFPQDITEDGAKNWFEDGIQNPGCVVALNIPKNMDNTYKKRGFVEFKSKSDLEKALKLSGNNLNERKVYVDVAAPNTRVNGRSSGGFGGRYASGLSLNWSKGSGAPPQQFDNSYNNEREHQQVDWSMKGANVREQRNNGPSAASLDWSQRGQNLREPRNDGPPASALDWSQKGQNVREPRNDGPSASSLDWSQKGQNIRETRERSEGPSASALDWSQKGQNVRETRERSEGPAASSLDWSQKGANVRQQRESPRQKTASPTSFDWSKKGAFVGENRSQRNSKNNENKEIKNNKTLGFESLSLDEE